MGIKFCSLTRSVLPPVQALLASPLYYPSPSLLPPPSSWVPLYPSLSGILSLTPPPLRASCRGSWFTPPCLGLSESCERLLFRSVTADREQLTQGLGGVESQSHAQLSSAQLSTAQHSTAQHIKAGTRSAFLLRGERGKLRRRQKRTAEREWQWEISEQRAGKAADPASCCCCLLLSLLQQVTWALETGQDTSRTEGSFSKGGGVPCLTVWRLWEWAPISSMMSPVVVHACCGRRAPSLQGWTPSCGRAVPVFSVSGILFGFFCMTQLRLSLSLFLITGLFTPRGSAKRAAVRGYRAAQEKTETVSSPVVSPSMLSSSFLYSTLLTPLTANCLSELLSHLKDTLLWYDMHCVSVLLCTCACLCEYSC